MLPVRTRSPASASPCPPCGSLALLLLPVARSSSLASKWNPLATVGVASRELSPSGPPGDTAAIAGPAQDGKPPASPLTRQFTSAPSAPTPRSGPATPPARTSCATPPGFSPRHRPHRTARPGLRRRPDAPGGFTGPRRLMVPLRPLDTLLQHTAGQQSRRARARHGAGLAMWAGCPPPPGPRRASSTPASTGAGDGCTSPGDGHD